MGILTLDHVTKQFGGLTAVNDLSIDLEMGCLHGLIGPNGAGKTTVFNLITGIYQVTSGTITLDGTDIKGKLPSEITKMGVARTFQNLRLFKKQTVLGNIRIASQLHCANYSYLDAIFKTSKYREQEKMVDEKARELLSVVGLSGREDLLATNLPYGLQRRMEIARALATEPKVLLLDEPAAGMNPEETRDLTETIANIRKKYNVAILLIEHHMELVMDICEEITVLNFGNMIAQGTPAQVQADPVVTEAYLGGGDEEE